MLPNFAHLSLSLLRFYGLQSIWNEFAFFFVPLKYFFFFKFKWSRILREAKNKNKKNESRNVYLRTSSFSLFFLYLFALNLFPFEVINWKSCNLSSFHAFQNDCWFNEYIFSPSFLNLKAKSFSASNIKQNEMKDFFCCIFSFFSLSFSFLSQICDLSR